MSELPDPMTPLDCDLRRMPSMLLDVMRLRDSDLAQVQDADVFRCGVLSWAASWHQVPAGSLPDDDAKLAYLMGYGRDVRAFKRVRDNGGMRGWVLCSDGRLYHPVVCEKAIEAMGVRSAQKSRTEAARAAREAERRAAQEAKRGAKQEAETAQASENIQTAPSVTDCANPNVTESNITEQNLTKEERKEERTVLRTDAASASGGKQQGLFAPSSKPVTAKDTLWREGLPIIMVATGMPRSKAGPLMGKWLKTCRDDCQRLMRVLRTAEEHQPVDFVSWVGAAVSSNLTKIDNATRIMAELGLDDVEIPNDMPRAGAVVQFPGLRIAS